MSARVNRAVLWSGLWAGLFALASCDDNGTPPASHAAAGQSGVGGEGGFEPQRQPIQGGENGFAGTNGYTGGFGTVGLKSWDLSGVDLSASGPALEGLEAAQTRASELVSQLTRDEKLSLVHGVTGAYVGNVVGVPRLGIPALTLQDGPAGVGNGARDVTAFPAPITLAASWDPELVQRWGAAMGSEERGKGVYVHLAPMMNIMRVPTAGRNFESFGEDPFLAAEMAAADVRGIQSAGVVATAKHFVGNEQETLRLEGSSEIDSRTLHEIYYPPFVASVRAGVGAIMCAYNQLGGVFACENPNTLGDLKNQMGFTGWVMSDWSATHSTVAAAQAGLDMEMPGADFFGNSLARAVSNGSLPESRLDDMVRRILTSLARVGVLDSPREPTRMQSVRTEEHRQLALEAATRGVVLLANRGAALPLEATTLRRLLVVGAADASSLAVGGGSAAVVPPYVVTPLSAVQERAGAGVVVDFAANPASADTSALAQGADAVLVFLSVPSTEGADRPSLALSETTNNWISSLVAANPRTIVVLNAPGPVLLPWANSVGAVLWAGYPGQENGAALTRILFGDDNPGGKLPFSFPKHEEDLPGIGARHLVPYTEGLAVGYRGLDALGLDPFYPFGHGLSYTKFDYSNLAIEKSETASHLKVTFQLSNRGDRRGREVAQVYLGYPEGAGEPPRVLRGFAGAVLDPGESKLVSIDLTPQSFSYWNAERGAASIAPGTYQIYVGSSSRDLRLASALEIQSVTSGAP